LESDRNLGVPSRRRRRFGTAYDFAQAGSARLTMYAEPDHARSVSRPVPGERGRL